MTAIRFMTAGLSSGNSFFCLVNIQIPCTHVDEVFAIISGFIWKDADYADVLFACTARRCHS